MAALPTLAQATMVNRLAQATTPVAVAVVAVALAMVLVATTVPTRALATDLTPMVMILRITQAPLSPSQALVPMVLLSTLTMALAVHRLGSLELLETTHMYPLRFRLPSLLTEVLLAISLAFPPQDLPKKPAIAFQSLLKPALKDKARTPHG